MQNGVAVAKFAGNLGEGGQPGHLLNGGAPHHACMHGSAAAHNVNAGQPLQIFVGQATLAQIGQTVLDTGADGGLQGRLLLMDFLKHEMGVTALFRGLHLPLGLHPGPLHRLAQPVKQANAVRLQLHHIPLFQGNVGAGMAQQRGDVAGQEILALTAAHDKRAVLPGTVDYARPILEQDCQTVAAPYLGQSAAHSVQRVPLVVVVHQLDQHLTVGLTAEFIPFADQILPQLGVVFNDAVVDQAHPGRGVRVTVHVAGRAVGSPAGMTDAAAAVRQMHPGQLFLQSAQPALGLGHPDAVRIAERHARRIIAPVFQFMKPFQQHIQAASLSRISNDAAHGDRLPMQKI